MSRLITVALMCFGLSTPVLAEARKEVNHQGVVKVSGSPFNGTGLFRFAIVDPDTGINRWSNDSSIDGATGGTPNAAVSLTVENGVYTVNLGDTTVPNMTEIPSSLFADKNLLLRIWFDDGVNGIEQLTPDHKLTPAPYSHSTVIDPPIGSIVAWHRDVRDLGGSNPLPLPDGWVACNGQTLSDAASVLNGTTLPNLNGEVRFLRGTAGASGSNQEATQVAVTVETNNGGYFFNARGDQNSSSFNTDFDETTTTTAGTRGQVNVDSFDTANQFAAGRVRAKNMSVVWIMRIK